MVLQMITHLCWLSRFLFHSYLGNHDTLKLVNVIFRHGDRIPVAPLELYPKDPYINYDFGRLNYSILTESGKWRVYKLGEFLKNTYSTFLDKNYVPGSIEARSTDTNRTRESLNFVLKALYPNDSIPRIINPVFNDSLLLPQSCHQYIMDYLKLQNTPKVMKEMSKLDDLMKNLSRLTGKNMYTTQDIHFIYTTLENEKYMNLTLPSWTEDIFPDGEILKGSALQYKILNYDEYFKKSGGGILIRKIIDDMLSVKYGTLNRNRKLSLYSGHDLTVAAVLQTLGVYYPHVPKFASAVILELHEIKGHYFVKVVYYLGVPERKQDLQIPNCAMLCPLKRFIYLLENVIPSKVKYLCSTFEIRENDEMYKKEHERLIKLFKIGFT